MNDITLPGLLTVSWILVLLALLKPRWEMALVAVGVGGIFLAMAGDAKLLIAFLVLGGVAVAVFLRRRRKVSPTLDELALLAEYLSNQIISGVNLSQALHQAGVEAGRIPPTLPLPVLGPQLVHKAQMMQTAGMSEARVLAELGDQFEDLSTRSFFRFLAAVAQDVGQDGLADALEGIATRSRMYRDMEKSFQSRLAIARMTRYVMLILVPGLLYFITFHSPLMEGGILSNPLGVPLLIFDVLMLGLAMFVGNRLSSIKSLEF